MEGREGVGGERELRERAVGRRSLFPWPQTFAVCGKENVNIV